MIGSTVTLSNDIISDTGNIDIDGAVVLENDNGTITVSTLTGSGGTIDFSSTINATSASTDKEILTIVNGSGTVNVGGIIGGSTALKNLNIATGDTDTGAVTLNGIGSAADSVGAAAVAIGSNAAGGKDLASITFDGAFYTTSGTQTYTADSYPINGTNTAFTASGQNITFNDAGAGTLLLSNSTNLKIDTGSTAIGNISIGREITNTAGDATNAVDVELIAGTGSVSVSTIGGTGYINDVAISAGHADGITLNGNITTIKDTGDTVSPGGVSNSARGDVIFTGKVFLADDITIDTSSTGNDGKVTFSTTASTINSSAANTPKSLTITSGGGDVTFAGVIGGVDTKELHDLTVNATAGTGSIDILNIGESGDPGANGTVTLGNDNSTLVDFSGTTYDIGGTDATQLLVKSTSSGEAITFTGSGATTITTADGGVTMSNGVTSIAQNLTINTLGAPISINSVMGSSTDKSLTLNADSQANGSGTEAGETITIGAIGSGDEIGAVTLDGADGITLKGNIELSNTDGSNLDIDGKVFISGNVTLDMRNADEDGTIDFKTTIDGVTESGTAVADNLTIYTGESADGGSLTFNGAIGSTHKLTTLVINDAAGSGTGVDITIPVLGAGDGTGGTTGNVTIGNATGGGHITFSGSGAHAFNIDGKLTLDSAGGADSFKFSNDATITADGGIEMKTGGILLTDTKDLTLAATDSDITVVSVTGVANGHGEDFTISDIGTGTATVGAIGTDINDVTITATTIVIKGDITTEIDATNGNEADMIDLNGAVVIDGGARTLTTAGGDGINFSSTLNSTASEDNNLTIDSGTGAVVFTGNIGTASNGELGTLDVNTGGETGTVNLGGTVEAAAVQLGKVLLASDSVINTSSSNGAITFGSTIDGGANLDLLSGTGTITIEGDVGVSTQLTTLDINATGGTGNIEINDIGTASVAGVTGLTVLGNANTGTLTTDGTNYKFGGGITIGPDYTMVGSPMASSFTTAGNVSFLGNVTVDGTLTVDTSGGNISIAGNISSSGKDEVVSLSDGTGTGTITLGGTVTSGDITLIGDSGISIAGNITSNKDGAAGAISFTGPVTLTGNVTVTADDHADSTITFNSTSTVNASTSGGQSLTLDTADGAIAMQGAIGGTSTGALSSLTVNADGAGTIEIANIGASTVGVTGATAIGNTNTGTITLDGTVYKTTGSQNYYATGGQNIDITNTSGVTFTTTDTAVGFNTSGVDLANNGTTTINTGSGAGAVTFAGALESNGGNNDLLVITSGEGNVTFTGAVGATNALGGLDVNSSSGDGDITFSSTIGDSGNAGVVGTTAIGGTDTEDVNLAGLIYSFDGGTTITAADGDNIKLTGTGDVTFTTAADDIEFATGHIHLGDGSNLVVDTGATGGNITIAEIAGTSQETVTLDAGTGTTSVGVIGSGTEIGTLSIGSDENGGITLNGAITTDGVVTLDGPITLATGAINITTADDAINLQGTVDGTQALTLASGSGAVTVDGAIGSGTNKALTSLTVNSSGAGTIEIANIGTTSAAGVSGATAIGNTNTGTLTLDGTVYTTNAATYTAATGENIDLTGGATTTFTSSNDDITFGTATVEMANGSNLKIDTDTLGGAIDLAGGVMGTSSENITLTAGTGTVAIGAIGTGTEIADVSITTTANTTISGDFTGGSLTNSGPAIVSSDINLSTTGNIDFGSTLNSSNGNQSITFVTAADITITGVVGGSNPFSTFTITDGDTFTYSGGGSIAGFKSGKFSRTGGFAVFNPGPSIDNKNTIKKSQDKEIAFFDAPVFKLFNSFLAPTVTDLIKEKAPAPDDLPETVVTGSARSNSQFLENKSNLGTDVKDAEIKVDFLDGDILIIDKSLEVVTNDFESLETINEILDDLLIDDSSELSINSTGEELFKISSLNENDENSTLEDLLISFSDNGDLNQGKSFIF